MSYAMHAWLLSVPPLVSKPSVSRKTLTFAVILSLFIFGLSQMSGLSENADDVPTLRIGSMAGNADWMTRAAHSPPERKFRLQLTPQLESTDQPFFPSHRMSPIDNAFPTPTFQFIDAGNFSIQVRTNGFQLRPDTSFLMGATVGGQVKTNGVRLKLSWPLKN